MCAPSRSPPIGPAQGAPSASAAFFPDEFGLPLLVENWCVPEYASLPVTGTLAMTVDTDHRGTFRYDRSSRRVVLADWTREKSAAAAEATTGYAHRVLAANPGCLPVSPNYARTTTAHPVGGLRHRTVHGPRRPGPGGNKGLYVMDGSLLPGNVGGANPSLTIAAMAERAVAGIIAAGG
ncbi:hypothetical protein GCM10020000_76930 [Streptomyces olivoverticillatus]